MYDYNVILLWLGLILAFLMAVTLGGNDAAEPADCAVGAGVVSIKKAIILFVIFATIGALTQGYMVMKTIGKGIVPEISIAGAFASVLAAILWVNLISVKLGVDVSVTHSITGAVIGYGLAAYGWNMVNNKIFVKIVLSWLSSPLASLFLAYVFYKIEVYSIKKLNINVYSEKFRRLLSYSLIGALAFSAYAFGANDIANATGVYVTIAEKLGHMPDYNVMLILAIFGSVGVAVGGLIIGPKVISTMAFKVTKLNPLMGFAAELSNAVVVYLFTTIPYLLMGFGLPISTSLATGGSLIGVGLASGKKININKKTVTILVSFWILTVPVSIILSASIYWAINIIMAL